MFLITLFAITFISPNDTTPHLKNESAVEVNASAAWQPFASQTSSLSTLRLKIDANAFFFKNYIIGEFERRLSPMTVDAEGVKVYNNLSKAQIMNASFSADWQFAC